MTVPMMFPAVTLPVTVKLAPVMLPVTLKLDPAIPPPTVKLLSVPTLVILG